MERRMPLFVVSLVIALNTIVRSAHARRIQDDVPFAERCYRAGRAAYQAGRWREAGNHWHKYLALKAKEPIGNPDPIKERVNELMESLKTKLAPGRPASVGDESIPKPPKTNSRRQKKRRQKRGRVDRRRLPGSDRAVTATRLAAQAAQARRNGQLEEALRLYQLAERVDKGTAGVSEKAREIEREIAGGETAR